MTVLTLSIPYVFATSRPWRWGLFFIALVAASSITGFLFFLSNKKNGNESRLFFYLLISFGASCVLWVGTLFVLIALHGI